MSDSNPFELLTNKETTTGEPVTEQAPTSPSTQPTTAAEQTPDTPAAFLPADYLDKGYYATTDKGGKYLRPGFVGEYAETMAVLLADMKPSDLTGLMREMKRSRKRALPFEARLTAVAEMLPKSMALVSHKKAPALLVTFIKDNLDHIHDDDDWYAFLRFIEAISGFLSVREGGD